MNKKIKRILSLVLAATLTLGVTACGGKSIDNGDSAQEEIKGSTEEESGKISEEVITLTVGGAKPTGLEDWKDLACIDEYRERFGINLECDFEETDWGTKRTLMFAENSLPDLIFKAGLSIGDTNTYGSQGYLLDFNEYRDLMPNMVATFEEYPELEAYLTDEDGHIYGMTQLRSDMTDRLARVFVNRNWLNNLGLEVPTTLDELYDVLVAFKEQDANGNGDATDEIPMLWETSAGFQTAERAILDAFGIYASGAFGFNYIMQADENGEVFLANTSDNYKEFLKFMKKLWSEGLIEEEAFTADANIIISKGSEDKYGFMGLGSAPFILTASDISNDKDWVAIEGLKSEYNPNRGVSVGSPVVSGINLVASADTEYPEEIAKFVDFFFSEEGMMAGAAGFEGQGWEWEMNEALGVEIPKRLCPEGYESAEDYRITGSVFNSCLNLRESNLDRVALFEVPVEKLSEESVLTEFGWAALVAAGYRADGVTGVDVYPTLSYSNEETEKMVSLKNDVTSYLTQMRAEFITGQTDIDKGWEDYVTTVNEMGMDQLLEIEQAAYDRFQQVGK